jgi:hypothetical protein
LGLSRRETLPHTGSDATFGIAHRKTQTGHVPCTDALGIIPHISYTLRHCAFQCECMGIMDLAILEERTKARNQVNFVDVDGMIF